MQSAKVIAGELNDAAKAAEKITMKMKKDIKASEELEDFTDPKQVTKAERLMEAMADDAKDSAKLRVALGRAIALAKPQHEHLGAANQYYPIMYFIDKTFLSTMQTGGGEALDKPLVGTSMDGCASACDAVFQKCVGFSYFGTGKTSLCFLISKFKSVTYYTRCKVPGMLLQRDMSLNGSMSSLLMGTAATGAGRSASKHDAEGQSSSPGPVSIAKWTCKNVGQPLQALNKKGKSAIFKLNIDSGEYDELFAVKKTKGNKFKRINACSINPVDSILYCAMRFEVREYLVRIDSQKFAYVARMRAGQYSATFDPEGNYYSWGGLKLRRITKVQTLEGYANRKQAPDLRKNAIDTVNLGADMAAVTANFEGTGAKTYLVGLKGKAANIVRVSGGSVKHWRLRASGLDGACKAWGSAWSFKAETYFSCNKGKGVYQLDPGSVNLKTRTVKFYKAGKSVQTDSNDGMNCMEGLSPFKPALPPRYEPNWIKEPEPLVKELDKVEQDDQKLVKVQQENREQIQKIVGGGGAAVVLHPPPKEADEKDDEDEDDEDEDDDDDEDEDDDEDKDEEEKAHVEVVPAKDLKEKDKEDVASGQVYCMAKFSVFEGLNLKPDPSGKCKLCLKELSKAERCYD